jgi:AAA+ ATPase superfamily predicted ATPase
VRKLPEKDALNELFHQAEALVKEELSSLLLYSRRYGLILKAVAMGNETWSEIKEYLEFKAGRIKDVKFSLLLKNLVNYGYLDKGANGYSIPDPVIAEVVKKIRLIPLIN